MIRRGTSHRLPRFPEFSAMTDRPATTPQDEAKGQSLWGGRFSAKPAEIMQAINVSIGVDQRLWREDLTGSRAHCRMLADRGIITGPDAEAILGGLDAIQAEIEAGTFPFRDAYEDIHMNVEARLSELVLENHPLAKAARRNSGGKTSSDGQ